eukprot:9273265-Alexandrium_andersonii.AAC.1
MRAWRARCQARTDRGPPKGGHGESEAPRGALAVRGPAARALGAPWRGHRRLHAQRRRGEGGAPRFLVRTAASGA